MKFSAFAVAALLVATTAASHATTTVRPSSGLTTLSFNDLTFGTPDGGIVTGAFEHTFDFALPSAAGVSLDFSETKVVFSNMAFLDIDFSGAGAGLFIIDHDTNNVLWSAVPTASGALPDTASLESLVITAPKFDVVVKGMTSGLSGGTYSFGLLTTPVPEPQSYALALSGLALAGVFLSRRRRSH